MRILLTAALIALVAACGSTDDGGASPDGRWVAVSGVSEGVDVPLVDGFAVTASIDGDRIEGTAACNGYGGTVAIGGGGSFEATELSWTEIGCEPAVMAVEQTYLVSLARFTTYAVADGMLTLSSPTDEWVFEPATSG